MGSTFLVLRPCTPAPVPFVGPLRIGPIFFKHEGHITFSSDVERKYLGFCPSNLMKIFAHLYFLIIFLSSSVVGAIPVLTQQRFFNDLMFLTVE